MAHQRSVGALAFTFAVVVGASACTDESPSGAATNASVVERLDCDRLDRHSDYEPMVFAMRPGSGNAETLEVDRAPDCFRDGQFVGRVHRFTSQRTADRAQQVLNTVRYPPQEGIGDRQCTRAPMLLRGKTWIISTVTRQQAEEARRRVGGRVLPPVEPDTSVVSYGLPCTDEVGATGR